MKRIIALIGIFISISVSAQTEKELAERAQAYFDVEEYRTSIKIYDVLIGMNSKNYLYYLNRGWGKLHLSGFEEGQEDLIEAATLNNKCSRCNIGLAIFALRGGNMKSALDLANDAIKFNDTGSFNYYIRAQILETGNNFAAAETDYNMAIALDSTVADYYYTRGSYLFRRGRTEFAINDFNNAIKLRNNVPDYYFQRGYCLYLVGRLNESLKDLEKAISMDSNNGDYYLAKGAVEDALGNKANSILSYSDAIVLLPENPLTYFNRANAYYELDNLDSSCLDYGVALALLLGKKGEENVSMANEIAGMMSNHCDTGLASYYYQRGLLSAKLQQYDEAVIWYNRGLEKWPEHPLLHTFKGNSLLYLKKYKEAENAYTMALQSGEAIPPDVSRSYMLITQNIDVQGYMRSTFSYTYDGRSKARMALNNPEGALKDVDMAIFLGEKIEGFDINNYFVMRANVLANLGRYSESNLVLNNLIHSNPGIAEAYVIRARISLEKALLASGKKVKLEHDFSDKSGMYYLKMPKKINQKNIDKLLIQSALEDIRVALEIKPNLSEAYFVSGQLKYFSGQMNYCADFLLAAQFGITDAMQLVGNPCEENK